MIDTNKYEGHTEGPWLELEVDKVVAYEFDENDNAKMICNVFRDGDGGSGYKGEWKDGEVEANQRLIVDAPLLLATIDYIREVGRMEKGKEVSGFFLSIMEKVLTTEEYLEWRNEE